MFEKFIIQGKKPLKGIVEVRGAKNAAFPLLAATLLTKEDCLIENLPLIEDVFLSIKILESLGAEISWEGKRTLKIRAKNINPDKIRKDLISKFRGSVLFFGPLLARFHKAKLPQPGGCLIGARPVDTHLDAFSQLGVKVSSEGNSFKLELPRLSKGGRIILNEFSVTATENLLLFASLIPKKTIIKNADADYSVQELSKFLKKMGVRIKGVGTHILEVKGKKQLRGVKHKLISDPIEAGTFILMTACAKGRVLVKNVEFSFLEFFLKRLRDFGLPYQRVSKNSIGVKPWTSLKIDKIQSLPYPGLATDLLPLFGVLATQIKGPTLIHDPLYEGRLKYLEEINKMGGQIIFADPHRAIISGPTPLYGIEVASPDLRGGVSLIAAALIAKGQSIIGNVYQIDRGYERIEERLQKLGANIKRIKA